MGDKLAAARSKRLVLIAGLIVTLLVAAVLTRNQISQHKVLAAPLAALLANRCCRSAHDS